MQIEDKVTALVDAAILCISIPKCSAIKERHLNWAIIRDGLAKKRMKPITQISIDDNYGQPHALKT